MDAKKTHVKLIGFGAGLAIILVGLSAYYFYVARSCSSFYDSAEKPFAIPGVKSGFVPQDMYYLEDEDTWLFSGYNPFFNAPSPIYVRAGDGSVKKIVVTLPDGAIYRGHGAAVTAQGDNVFLTVSDGYVVLSKKDLLSATDGSVIQSHGHVPVELEPAFMTIQNGVLYIGEFYQPLFYPTPKSHWVKLDEGKENPALIYAYEPDENGLFGFSEQATAVYSIPADIQGMCITDDNRMVLSRAWGVGDASLLVYDLNKTAQKGTYMVDGHEAPLYVLDSNDFLKSVTVPPMAEGIDFKDGKVFLANESASNLYLLGKPIGGKNVYAFEV